MTHVLMNIWCARYAVSKYIIQHKMDALEMRLSLCNDAHTRTEPDNLLFAAHACQCHRQELHIHSDGVPKE